MTKRKPRTIPYGARVTDGRRNGTALNNTGLSDILDPRIWIWIHWDGSPEYEPARTADLTITETTP